MKLTNKILEAVNRGIKFALDDFEDDNIQGQTNSKVSHYKGSWNEVLDSFIVDLGLPSGTRWCKYNLGANTETEYGDYYAWGELTTKDKYSDENYTYKNRSKQLPRKHDVASQKLGNNYSIPTKELLDELLKYTDNKWVENYNGSSINGMLFTSKINSNTLFIPTAGYYSYNLNDLGSDGYIWSSSAVNRYHGCYLGIFNGNVYIGINYRYEGLSVRPVYKN